MSDKSPMPSWLRFRLSEAIVFTSLIASLFAASALLRRSTQQFPPAPQVSLAAAKKQIAAGNVASMKLGAVGDVVVGYAALLQPAGQGDDTQAFKVALRRSDGSVDSLCKLLDANNVPFILTSPDIAATWLLPSACAALLLIAAVVYLRIKNRRPTAG